MKFWLVSTSSALENKAYKVVGVFAVECEQKASLGCHPALPRKSIEIKWLFVSRIL